jgi:uncharacterized protein (TIGR02246 family)
MSTEQMGPIREAITSANRTFMDTFARGDAAGMAALYTPDGQLLPTGSDVVAGPQPIQAFWQAVMGMGIKEATLETVEVEAHGDAAHEVGRYTLKGAGGQLLDQGKYVVIWKQVGGQWKLHRDIWNSSLPAARQ